MRERERKVIQCTVWVFPLWLCFSDSSFSDSSFSLLLPKTYVFKNICPQTFPSLTWTLCTVFNYSSVLMAMHDTPAPKPTLGYRFLLSNACLIPLGTWNSACSKSNSLPIQTQFLHPSAQLLLTVVSFGVSWISNSFPSRISFFLCSSHFSSSNLDFYNSLSLVCPPCPYLSQLWSKPVFFPTVGCNQFMSYENQL